MNLPPFISSALTAPASALVRCFHPDQHRTPSSSLSCDVPELSRWKLLWGAWFTCALLAAFGSLRVHAQFAPATGPVNSAVNFQNVSSGNAGFFTTIDNAAKTLSITRPGNPTVSYSAPGGTGTRLLTYAWIGPAGLLAKTTETDGVNSRITLHLLRLQISAIASVQAPGLISRTFFTSEHPNLRVDANSDGLVLFTRIFTDDVPGNDSTEITLWRTDTGASLCGLGSVDRQSGDSFTAAVSGTDVSITWHKTPTDFTTTCPLPKGVLVISPQPLAFGQILNNTTADLPLTLSNTGDDTITVNSIGTSAHYGPFGFAPVTLQPSGNPGSSSMVTIRFNPAGQPATGTQNFNGENLAINRTPANGASTVVCNGSARAPVPKLGVAPLNFDFGCVVPGSSPTRTFTLNSTGDLPVTVTGITGPAAPYTLTPPPPATFAIGTPIPPGAPAKTFTITFSPTAAGTFNDSIVITSNDPANPTRTVQIHGVGHVPAPKFVQDPTVTNLNYGSIEVGYRFGKGVKFKNTGDLDLQFTVEVIGDPRFTVSTTPNTPGPGVRGPFVVTIPANAMCGGGVTEQILRVTFDATLPVGGPDTGTLRITGINDPTAPAQPIDISLTGGVIAAKSLDAALVVDRSGSMAEPMAPGAGTKAAAVRSASRLFFELMRVDVGDRAALLQFNTSVDPLVHRLEMNTANKPTFINAVQNGANLNPGGGTSIAGGLFESFKELNDPAREVRAALVVTDGNDNTPYTIPGTTNTVSLDTLQTQIPPGIAVHALCLGTAANTDLGRLTALANASGGLAKASDNVSSLGIFDVEKFFLQAATTILGGTTSVDPVDKIYPGKTKTWQVELIPADKAVSFVLLFKVGALPFTVVAPDGTVYPLGAPPAGFGQSYSTPPNARILRLQLPTNDPAKYAGIWKLIVRHDGYLEVREKDQTQVNIKDPVDYAFAVSVFSNLRMVPLVSPAPLHPGNPITVTAFLTEEETKVLGSDVDVNIKYPDTVTTRSLHLYDDGAHNDGAANDGEYGNVFTQTNQAGAYTFAYHATGTSALGGHYVREADISQYVTPVIPTHGGDDGGPGGHGSPTNDGCCTRIVRLLVVIAVICLVIALLLLRRPRAGS